MTIAGAQFTLQFANNGPLYKGDVKQIGGPQEFDFVQKEGPEVGKVWQALVSSNGQLLKICFNYPRGRRPAEHAHDLARRGNDADRPAPEV